MNWYYTTVKRYYDAGRYTKEQVAVFVAANKITSEQYEEITGDAYVAS